MDGTGPAPRRAPARRSGGRSARVRAAVLEATLAALAEVELEDLSIAEVARRAGVHPTSIYRRWGDRVNLGLDAVLSLTAAGVPIPDTGSLSGDLVAILRSSAAFLATPGAQLLLRTAVGRDLGDYETVRDRFWAERFRVATALLRRAEGRGELRPGLDPRLVLETLIGTMVLRALLTHEPVDEPFIRRLVDLQLGGIAAPAAPVRP
jgi:AcrR family transcriptional regulator